MPKRGYTKPSPAQQRATMNNHCMRAMAGLMFSFRKGGHHDFEKLIEDLDAKFRAKVKGLK